MADPANPLVSIGIPTYNRANSYLTQALQSAVNQTYKNIEIIVSDNCSSDDTESVVKDFNDPRIRYYRQKENIGSVPNCNFCLEQSQGKYFLVLYDDDVIDDDFISTCMEAVQPPGEPGVIFTGAREIDSRGNVLSSAHNKVSGYSTADFLLGWFDAKVPLYLCSTVFNTERLKQLGGFHSKTNMYEDVVAFVQLAARYGRVDVFDIKASFRRHDSNMGKTVPYYAWSEDALYLLDIMCEAAPEQASQIRQKGLPYFSSKVYRHIARIESPLKRFSAYLAVYRTFDRCYSPLKFLYVQNVRRLRNRVKRAVSISTHCL
jgi:glycosyltransferase involved in cell wall biosynthesis